MTKQQGSTQAMLTDRELGTVLAALRAWQRELPIRENTDSPSYQIATDGGKFDALTVEEIDALCESFNCPDVGGVTQ